MLYSWTRHKKLSIINERKFHKHCSRKPENMNMNYCYSISKDKYGIHSFIHFRHAPPWVHSAKHRHHSPEWTILSHVNCFIQGEVQWFQVQLGSLHPCSTEASRWSPPVLQGEAVKICLASDSPDIRAVWPNRERRRAWTIAKRCGCPVCRLTSSFCTGWYHLIPNSLRRHHWSRAEHQSCVHPSW